MNANTFSRFAISITLALFTTGCCTQTLLNKSKETTATIFHPTAVYRSTNTNGFALEGISRENRDDQPMYVWMNQPGLKHIYLMISPEYLESSHFQTHTNLSPDEIRNLPPDSLKNLKIEKSLPSNYVKVADLSHNYIALVIKESHPSKVATTVAVIIFAPFTLALDIIGAPFEIPIMYAFNKRGPG